ncbi:MAG: polysaccharide deacetylase family protein, partial [Candidatus Hodarchaeota archaeon]
FPPLNMAERLRLGFTIFYASKIKSWERLEKISAADWLTRLSGKRTLNKVWLPLLKSKLGNNYKVASASFIWANIARMYAARRSGLKQEMFGYVDGGYGTILNRFQRLLDETGVQTFCQTPVSEVTDNGGSIELKTITAGNSTFDAVILTIPCDQIPELCPELSTSEKKRCRNITYNGIISMALLLKKSLAGYYITNITEEWVPFTGVIEMTALVDKAYFEGNSLIYLPRYLNKEDRFWQKSNAKIREESLAALQSMYPSFQKDDVVAFKISRASHVLPVTTMNYSAELLPPTKTSLEHVFVVNSAQIPNGTMNVNEIIGLANLKANEIAHILSSEAQAPKAFVTSNPERSAPLTYNDIDASNLKRSVCLASNNSKPFASISMDLDNQWSYMKTHGDVGWEKFPSYFHMLIPRVLDILDQWNLKITFFVVGQDAVLDKNRDALKLLAERGHEVGNHSFNHEPWFHLYSKDWIKEEILDAEEQIYRVTGQKPVGFRGPGFSWSRDLIEVLNENDYLYDASTLPTYLGPLARAYYFWKSDLTNKEKETRERLFGNFKDGMRPVKPYYWQLNSSATLLEIPVTTIPLIKTPFHLSYLLYISRFSLNLMFLYLKLALDLCLVTKTEPSFLLHPLDLIGCDQVSELAFFPGMDLSSSRKIQVFEKVVKMLSRYFTLVNMSTHAKSVFKSQKIKLEHLH